MKWKLFIILLFTIVFAGESWATDYVEEAHQDLDDITATPGILGYQILVGVQNVTLTTITKHPSSTPTRAYLYADDGTELANVSFVGDNATFDYGLINNTYYRIGTDDEGKSYNGKYGGENVVPPVINNTHINFIKTLQDSAPYSGLQQDFARPYNILSVTVSTTPPSEFPQWCCNGTTTPPPNYVNEMIYPYVRLLDDYPGLSTFIWSWYYNDAWNNGSVTDITGYAEYNITDQGLSVGDPQNVSWTVYFNDSDNQWNQTDIWTVEIYTDNPPTGFVVSQKSPEFMMGNSWWGLVNCSDGNNLSWWIFEEQLPNGSWINFSSSETWTTCFPSTEKTNCLLSLAGTPYPVGNHSWRVHFNDSVNQWGVTDIWNFTVTTYTPIPTVIEEENIFIDSIKKLAKFGNVSLAIFWLLIMVLISIVMWVYFHGAPLLAGGLVLGTSLIMSFFALTVGIFSPGLFSLLILFVIVAGYIMFKRRVIGFDR